MAGNWDRMSGTASAAEPNAGRAVRAAAWAVAHLGSIAGLLVGWELFARSGAVTMFMLPPFSAVAERIWAEAVDGNLWLNIGLTLYRAFVGFLLACAIGVGLGIAMARTRWARWFFDPIISVGFPMPKVVFLPVVILWLGVFDVSKITMVALEAVFPVVTATVLGIQGVGHELLWSARNMGAKDRELLWQVLLPAAFPQIMTGIQVALPIALIVAVFTEMAMGGFGLGGAMMQASRFADSRGVFAGIVEIAVVGYCVVKGLAIVRWRLLLWHQEAVAPSTV
jgi:ABC-type nitrate/sulfonate/bicarbonate transport system permease component